MSVDGDVEVARVMKVVGFRPSDSYGGRRSVPATILPRNGEMNAYEAHAPANLMCSSSTVNPKIKEISISRTPENYADRNTRN